MIAKIPASFDPIHTLEALAGKIKPSCAFDAKTPAEARRWQSTTRRRLQRCLGVVEKRFPMPQVRMESKEDCGQFTRARVIFKVSPETSFPAYVLTPAKPCEGGGCVLALHGHGYGVKDIVGLWEDGSRRTLADGYHRDFACELARQGLTVIAPEIACFGEREHRYTRVPAPTTCHNAATFAMMLGTSVVALRVADARACIDYALTLPGVQKVGVMGISGGGMLAFFTAALDQRIAAAVISGYFCDWRKSILSLQHCTCNFVPGLLQLGELHDIAGLIAPRPLLVENGTHDDIFPIEDVRQAVNLAKRCWQTLEAADQLRSDYFDGRHRIGDKGFGFLQHALNAEH